MNGRKGALLIVLSATIAALLSTQLARKPTQSFLQQLGNLCFFPSFIPSPAFLSRRPAEHDDGDDDDSLRRRHHRRHDPPPPPQPNATAGAACDDFPPDIPPPDSNTTTTCVDRNGCCNFTTVQSAVAAAAVLGQRRTVIWINKGIYYEKVTIPRSKPNITLQGQGWDATSIVWNDTANSSSGTFFSAIFSHTHFHKQLKVAPAALPGDVGGQAVAIRVGGDQAAFWGCGFFGAQDTLHDDKGRHYFKECYIQGSIDFIFGDGRSLYEGYQLISIAGAGAGGGGSKFVDGAVTAQGRAAAEDENGGGGFSFVNCSVGGTGLVWLGRAWRPYSRVVFSFTSMTSVVSPDGWNNFGDPMRNQTVFYGEYMCTGDGANMSMRVPYAQKLNDTQAAPFLNTSYIDAQQWLLPFNST